ncbi:peptidase M14 [candidate division KSB1 bacterium]|nr:peptidase M14 [candidate division KSB1 bacterium]NIR73459.1 peptidase M14 [candidate division KSB1 bacterium]NIS27074.1 peptidase M14 [candidate division KSB1 bacterium]NIT73918.1 peptidase M14 [candidate division KSB1 bacterium]NIU27819.1 peptidase M14 [candidate division KSB1 bacterium]
MLQSLKVNSEIKFRTCDEVRPLIKEACDAKPDIASYRGIGDSEEGRSIDAVVLGHGVKRVSLIAGAHSDEPVGPETLRTFILSGLAQKDRLQKLFETYQFIIIPHINPDGEAKNRLWTKKWPDPGAYLKHVFREPPGRDLEFGFANMRKENTHVSEFLIEHAPFVMHISLHSMAVAEGAMLLIERHWIDRTQKLRSRFVEAAQHFGLGLHDHDRKGEKGFIYIEPGFTTTPEGRAMRRHFESEGDKETADRFHDSSMEFVRKLGGDPLCLVTELPLFVINKKVENRKRGIPVAYLELKEKLPELRAKVLQGESISETIEEFCITPFNFTDAVRLQLQTIQFGLETAARH